MIIKLSPQIRGDAFAVVRHGDALSINGEVFDFAAMGDGDSLPRSAIKSEWFAGPVEKRGGELTLTLLFPIPSNYSPAQAFPADLLNVPNGPVALPQPLPEVIRHPEEEPA